MFNCNCGCTMIDEQQQQQQQQQNYTVITTTTLRTKRPIYIHILCNLQELNGGGRWELDIPCSDILPSRGIWCPRAVLHQVRSAWHLQSHVRSAWHLQSDIPGQMYPPVEASGCQEQYYVRSAWHWVILQVRLIFSQMYPHHYKHLVAKSSTKLEGLMGSVLAHLLFTCWRGKSYIAMQQIWVIENWAIYVDWSFCCCYCCCCCCCYCVMLLFFISNCRWTTTTKLHSNNNNNADQNINPDISYLKLSNLCRLSLLLLLLLLLLWWWWCNCVVATTTKLYIKHNKNKNKKINLYTFSVQIQITQSFHCCWSCCSFCCFCCYCVILL